MFKRGGDMEPTTEAKIRELLEVAKTHGLAEMSFQENGLKVAFRRAPGRPAPAKAAANGSRPVKEEVVPSAPPVDEEIIRSPIVGTFRRSASKDHPPLILEGNKVKPGDRLAVVECMKIPTDVVTYKEGLVTRILVEDGQVVEYGQPIFVIGPAK